MINAVLFRREMNRCVKLLVIFASILTLYITMVMSMYEPGLQDVFKQFESLMPDFMASVGMVGNTDTLSGFMSSYLYGMILLVFPMIFLMIQANRLVARYVDDGSMACLLSAPVSRRSITLTQYAVLISSLAILLIYCTVLEYLVARVLFPGQLEPDLLLLMNLGLLLLHLFIGTWCFLCSCIFNTSRQSLFWGAGIPVLMYVFQMMANLGGRLEFFKYLTFFTLYNSSGLLSKEVEAVLGLPILFSGAVLMAMLSVVIFTRKDMHL